MEHYCYYLLLIIIITIIANLFKKKVGTPLKSQFYYNTCDFVLERVS